MAEMSVAALQLLVIPDRRTVLSTDGVSMTATSEAGPRPGAWTEAQTSQAVFVATGTLDSDLTDIELSICRSGGPGSMEARWRHAGEDLRNWDPPTAVSEWEFIDRSTTAGKYARPHACRFASGLVVAVVTDAAAAITCWRQGATGKWSSSTVATVANSVATVAALPSGRVVCVYTASTGTKTQLRMSYSDDGGATWTSGSPACLESPLAETCTDITRIRMAVLGAEIVLFLAQSTSPENIYQYVSTNLGATFTLVESTTDHVFPDLAVRGGVAYVAYIGSNGVAPIVRPYVARLTAASRPLSASTGVELVADADPSTCWVTVPTLAILADDDGTLWVYAQDQDAGALQEIMAFCSTDGGATWSRPYKSAANGGGLNVVAPGVATSYATDYCIVAERGRAILLHTSVAATATADDSLCAAYLGGWTTVSLPHDVDYARFLDVGGWDQVWIPIERPADLGWARSVVGAPTQVLGSDGNTTTMGAGESQVYHVTPVLGAPNRGILWIGQVQVTSGTHTCDIRISDGANGYQVRLEVTTTTIRLYDLAGAAYIGAATATTAPQNGVVVIVCLDAPSGYGVGVGRVRAHFRGAGVYGVQGPYADRQWTAITGSTTVTRAAYTTTYLGWGCSLAAVAVAAWRWCGYAAGSYIAGGDGLDDPSRGRQVPDRTSPAHLEKGLRVSAVSGPALVGQTWTHSTSHDYPVEAGDVTFSPSPARRWRSTDDSVQQDIEITCDGGWVAGDLVAVWIMGANYPTASLYRGAGAAVKVMDCDLTLTGIDFTRTRDMLSPALSGTALPWYVREGALDGATFALDGTTSRRIRHSRGGMWPATAIDTRPKARLEIEGYDAGDPASGTGVLWMPRGLFLTTLMQSTDTLTLRIPAANTADGFHQHGIVMVGRAVALTHPSGWGNAYETATSVSLSDLRGGARRAEQLAANRKAWEVSWADSIDQTGLYSAGAPSYVTLTTGGTPHGDRPGTLPMIEGLLGELGGAKTCGVMCLRVPTQAGAITAAAPVRVIDPAVLMYGRIVTETWRQDNVLGDPGTDPGEVLRGGVLRIESEL